MSLLNWVNKLYAKHMELGRQHQELGQSISDLKREVEQVHDTVDKAIGQLQNFATRVKKSRSKPKPRAKKKAT